MKTFIFAAGLAAFYLSFSSVQANETTSFEIDVGKEALTHAMRFADPATKPSLDRESKVLLTLSDRKMGVAQVDGTLRMTPEGRLIFASATPMPFEPGPNTALGFATPRGGDSDMGGAQVIIHTGRWINFFGVRLCPGQVFDIPGESQCI